MLLTNTFRVLYYLLIILLLFAVGNMTWNRIQYLQVTHIAQNLELGVPAYAGPCPQVVQAVNTALGENRYLNLHVSLDGKENLSYYRSRILPHLNGAFSYAQYCEDKEAIGRLLFVTANITLDIAIEQAMPFTEAVTLAESYYHQADTIGYNRLHPLEATFLRGRIERNAVRAKMKAEV